MKTLIYIKQNILYLLGISLAFFSIFAFFEFYCKLLTDCSDILIKYWVTPVMSKINGWYAVFLIVLGLIYLLITCWVEKVLNKTHLILILLVFWIYVPARSWGPWEFYPLHASVAYSDIIFLFLVIEILNIIRIKMRKRKEYKGLDYCSPKEKGNKEDRDKYGRTTYVKSVAKHIAKSFPPDQSFATGIVGNWGSGKSWFLDEIKNTLVAKDSDSDSTGNTKPAFMQKMKKRLTYKENILIIDYKPWFCDSPNDIVRDFFALYKQKLGPYLPSLSGNIEQYAALLTEVVDNGWVKKAVKAVQIMGQQEEAAQEYFEKISKTLKKAQFNVLIVIDDLDRLQADEILEVLRLIRNTACFPYTHFLVAYDKGYLTKALDENEDIPASYLEKIFNFEIPLPKFEGNVICGLLNEYLEKLDSKDRFEDWDRLEEAVYYRTTDYLIPQILKTKRDVIRFFNSFKVNLGAYLDYEKENKKKIDSTFQLDASSPIEYAELSAVDFFYLELIRYRYQKVYDMLRNDALKIDGLTTDGEAFIYTPKSPENDPRLSTDKEDISKIVLESFIADPPLDISKLSVQGIILLKLFTTNQTSIGISNVNSFFKYFAYRADSKTIALSEAIVVINLFAKNKDLKIGNLKSILTKWNNGKLTLENELKCRLERLLKPMQKREIFDYSLQKKTIEFIGKLVIEKTTWPRCAQEAEEASVYFLRDIKFKNEEYGTVECLRNVVGLWYKTFEWGDDIWIQSELQLPTENNSSLLHEIMAENLLRIQNDFPEVVFEALREEVIKAFRGVRKPLKIISVLERFWQDSKILSYDNIEDILSGYLTIYIDENSEIDEVGRSLFLKYRTLVGPSYPKEGPSIVKSLNAFVKKYPSVYINDHFLDLNSHNTISPHRLYKSLSFTNEEIGDLISSPACDTCETIDRIRNFWKLYKANDYYLLNLIKGKQIGEGVSLMVPSASKDIQKMMKNNFVDQVEQLEKLEKIDEELEKMPIEKSLQELKTEVENNSLNIKLRDDLLEKINNLINSTSATTSTEEAEYTSDEYSPSEA